MWESRKRKVPNVVIEQKFRKASFQSLMLADLVFSVWLKYISVVEAYVGGRGSRVLGLQMLLSCSGTMWVEVECLVRVNTSYEEFWYKNEFDPWLCHQIILLFIKFAAQSIMSVT